MKEHDKLALRLAIILTRLLRGQKLKLIELCQEFNVSERTLQRDFNTRRGYLPLERQGNHYWLSADYLPRPSNTSAQQVMKQMGMDKLLPTTEVEGRLPNSALLFKASEQQLDPVLTRKLIQAISQQQALMLNVANVMMEVEPYKLVFEQAQWYLAASWQRKLQSVKAGQTQGIETAAARLVYAYFESKVFLISPELYRKATK
ncbi:hypothetical protein NFHSH190041_06860 [Shewanella sp. NFH-SH190041]|uniref:DeoR family transcriptional regulator n=1 Tax=Shewanella sp. NFH-SH190041 TaxID=2950245 RepID=UPI0021C2977C|nr:DeoR family transcriptional regulator [Shewanella sp. NFH-SH190041]BDM63234.1 hypothetical protein NFHSH190041_06860 [Shewanella sp. NFH-SH190041]